MMTRPATPVWHFSAHTMGYEPLLVDPDLARRVWAGLRRAFPHALSAKLMPDHAHVTAEEPDPAVAQLRLARARARAVHGRGKYQWAPVDEPTVVWPGKIGRSVRYDGLNPCRPWSGRRPPLVDDPLQWPWSTHRDLVGAQVDPWVTASDVLPVLRWSNDKPTLEAFHGYVCRDERVAPHARQLPSPAPPSAVPVYGLDDIGRAVAAATRCPAAEVTSTPRGRRLLVAAARTQGWTSSRVLADACGLQRQAITRMPPPKTVTGLDAVLLCLGAPRLRLYLIDELPWPARPRREK